MQRIPSGRYVVTYDGDGDLFFGMDASVVSERKGRIEIDVRLSPAGVLNNGIYLQVVDTNPSNPLRNIRVLLPGTETLADDGMPFHPVRLAALFCFRIDSLFLCILLT